MVNWRTPGREAGSLVAGPRRARRPRDGTAWARGVSVWGFAAAVVLVLVPGVGADDYLAAPGSSAGGLTAQSSWADIMKTPGVRAGFPMLDFGNMYVPLSAVCVEDGVLRIADPRLDNGVRLSAEALAAMASGHSAAREDPFSVGPAALADQHLPGLADQPQHSPIGFPVSVYKNTWGVTTARTPLFQKTWEPPTCRGA